MGKNLREMSWAAIISFLVSLILCGVLIGAAINNKVQIENLQAEELILEINIQMKDEISRLLSKARALSVLVIQGNGSIVDFDKIASTIIADDPVILNLLLAPDGIVSEVYPLPGNEAIIGWNFFSEGVGNKEAMAAMDSDSLVLAGPFEIVQSGQTLAGRMPVYISTSTENYKFWGFVSVSLKFPEVLENTGIDILDTHNLEYELWRINPDTAEKQVITHNVEHTPPGPGFVERSIYILNAEWHLKVWLAHKWYNFPETYVLIITGFFVSLIVLLVVQDNVELRRVQVVFEEMANVDPVTGIHNRRYMDENLRGIIKTLSRSDGTLSLLMIDVDLFKNYNDAYGHSKGDICLKCIAEVLRESLLRADDFVARYGGEEFVVVLPNTDENGARMIAERLLESIQDRNIPHEASNVASYITISIGVTTGIVQHTYSGDDYIKRADKALYISKQNGRNRYTYLNL
jgi:diguanylate cyclase (GGDEF)-like protein